MPNINELLKTLKQIDGLVRCHMSTYCFLLLYYILKMEKYVSLALVCATFLVSYVCVSLYAKSFQPADSFDKNCLVMLVELQHSNSHTGELSHAKTCSGRNWTMRNGQPSTTLINIRIPSKKIVINFRYYPRVILANL